LLHFSHNILRFSQYPEPAWITGPRVVDALWLAMTPLLLLGWILAKQRLRVAALGVLWAYAILSLFVLGHYFYAPPTALPSLANCLIALEATAAAVLLVLAPIAVPRHRDVLTRLQDGARRF
jgi:hypothetical protein